MQKMQEIFETKLKKVKAKNKKLFSTVVELHLKLENHNAKI
jgi:hypothetical protein